jgi:hypothetical protein
MPSDSISLNNSTIILTVGLLNQNMSTIGDVEFQMSLNGNSLLWEVVHLGVLRKCLVFVESFWV